MAGDSLRLPLPIRLVPRKRPYLILVIFFGFFFAFSIFWIGAALQPDMRLEFNDREVTDPAMRRLFPLFGLPFLLFGAAGLSFCLLPVLPRSPFYHVELTAQGLRTRTLNRRSEFAWRDLPAFETLEVVSSDSDGTTRNHFAVAMRPGAPAPSTKSRSDPREIVRVAAGEYGGRDTEADAQVLADWLNQVRDHALFRRTDGIDIPAALHRYAIGLSAAAQPRSHAVTRR